MDEILDVAIVGAGIGGLTAAWRLRHRRIAVLEAGARPGGRLLSAPRGDYWLNFGAHLFGDATSPAGGLAAELGLETRVIPGNRMGIAMGGRLVAGGRPELYPLRLPLSLAERFSFVRMGLRLKRGVALLGRVQAPRPGETAAARRQRQLDFLNDRTMADFVGRLSPGVARLLTAITERTSADPSVMAAGYGLTSFGQVWSKQSFGRNLHGGSARLPQAIAAALGEALQLGAEVLELRQGEDHVVLRYRQAGAEHLIRARQVVLACQADVAARIAPDLPQETRAALAAIRYGAFLSVAVLTDEAGPMPWDGTYAVATPGRAFSVFFNMASTLRTGARAPGGSLMLFRGADGAAELMRLSDAEICARFRADLEALFPEARGRCAEMVVQRWPQGAPYSFPGRAGLQAALTRDLGRIHLAGDYLEFPCMDAAISTATESAERIARLLD